MKNPFRHIHAFFSRHVFLAALLPNLLSYLTYFLLSHKAKRKGISRQALIFLRLFDIVSPFIKKNIKAIVTLARLNGIDGFERWLRGNVVSSKEVFDDITFFKTTPKGGATTELTILYLHGGAFVADILPYYGWMLASLSEQLGCTVVMPVYPLAPEYDWTDTKEAIHKSYNEIEKRAGAKNIVIMGDSAGGQMSLALARDLAEAKRPSPRCLVLFSPFLDLACQDPDQEILVQDDPLLSIPFLREGSKLWLRKTPLTDPQVNLISGKKLENLPPTLVFTGTRDVLNSDARRLKAQNPDVLVAQYHGMPHIWVVFRCLPEAHQALKEAVYFIRHPDAAKTEKAHHSILENSVGKSWVISLEDANPVKNPNRLPGNKSADGVKIK